MAPRNRHGRMTCPVYMRTKGGKIVPFRKGAIEASIAVVMHHLRRHDPREFRMLTEEVCMELHDVKTVSTERIRSAVLRVLGRHNLHDAMRYYEFVFLHIPPSKIRKVVKRDGTTEEFDPHKIYKAIRKALFDSDVKDGRVAERLAREVVDILNKKYPRGVVPVETIKEDVEYVLVKHRLPHVAKSYMLYRYM